MAQKYLRFSPMLMGSRYTMHLELLHTKTHLPIFTLLLDTVHYQRRAHDVLTFSSNLTTSLSHHEFTHISISVQITRQKAHFLDHSYQLKHYLSKLDQRGRTRLRSPFNCPPPTFHSIPSLPFLRGIIASQV